MSPQIFTIGHSNHTEQHFLALLNLHSIQAVADVRSAPYSRFNPHFDRESLQHTLAQANIRYVFLGNQLGARSDDPTCYAEGRVRFDRLAQSPAFLAGLSRIRAGATKHRIALMCAEKEPLDCHRTILVARHLAASGLTAAGLEVFHIHPDGALETQSEAIARLTLTLPVRATELHLFRSEQDLAIDVYALQEQRIAFRPPPDAAEHEASARGVA